MTLLKNIPLNSICPCGSNKSYKACCSKKAFSWKINEAGDLVKTVKLNKPAFEILRKQKQDFIKIFEREPNKDDPVFLEKYLFSEEDMKRETLLAMEKANLSPAFIYAYEKTGLLISEGNLNKFSTDDIKEWDDTVDEYYALNKKDQDNPLLLAWADIHGELEPCIYVLGLFLEKEINKPSPKGIIKHNALKEYIYFCAVKTLKLLKSIFNLLEKEIGDDALILTRSLYENYLHIIFAKHNPDKITNFYVISAIKIGLYEYEKHPNGKEDRRFIVDKKTGEKYKGHISNYEMAFASDFEEDLILFDYLYSYLSEYTHPDILTIINHVDDGGYDHHASTDSNFEVLYYTIMITTMILDELRTLKRINPLMRRDLLTIIKRSKVKLPAVNKLTAELINDAFLDIINNRLKLLGDKNRKLVDYK